MRLIGSGSEGQHQGACTDDGSSSSDPLLETREDGHASTRAPGLQPGTVGTRQGSSRGSSGGCYARLPAVRHQSGHHHHHHHAHQEGGAPLSSRHHLFSPTTSSSRLLIDVEGAPYAWWERLTRLLAYVTALQVPVSVAFQARCLPLTAAMDCVFILDTIVNFFIVKYFKGSVVVDRAQIAKVYLQGNFWLDAVSALPMDSIIARLVGESDAVSFLCVLRLLRLRRAAELTVSLEKNISFNYYYAVVFKLASILVLIAHFQACGFWYLAYLKDFDETTWPSHFGEYKPGQTAWDHYLTSLYWTYTTMSTTGYGDLAPYNDDERFYTLIMMILNLGLTAYIVGNMTMLATKADASTMEYRDVVRRVKEYMELKSVEPGLLQMTLQHLRLNHELKAERDDVLEHCSPYIRHQILSSMYKDKLRSCAVFLGTSDSFLDSIAQAAHLEFIHQDSPIVQMQERATQLCCILSGFVEVFDREDRWVQRLTQGASIGEETVLCDFPMARTYVAQTLVKMLVVPVAAVRAACQQNKLDHRISCSNLEAALRALDPAQDPDKEERADKVVSYVTATKTDHVTKLCYAAASGDIVELKLLLRADPEHDVDMGDYDGRRPLHIAAAYGRLEAVQFLLFSAKANANVKDAMGGTPLQDAVKNSQIDACQCLRDTGAELLLEDTGSVLCNCVIRGKADLLEKYLEYGADPNLGDYDLRTPLHIACAEGLLPMVRCLVHYGADEHARDRWGETPLNEAQKNKVQMAVLSFLETVSQRRQSGDFRPRRVTTTPRVSETSDMLGPGTEDIMPPPFRETSQAFMERAPSMHFEDPGTLAPI